MEQFNKEHPMAWKFNRAYANIPLGLRSEIVAVVNHEPMTWQIIRQESEAKTEMGFRAIQQLIDVEIL